MIYSFVHATLYNWPLLVSCTRSLAVPVQVLTAVKCHNQHVEKPTSMAEQITKRQRVSHDKNEQIIQARFDKIITSIRNEKLFNPQQMQFIESVIKREQLILYGQLFSHERSESLHIFVKISL